MKLISRRNFIHATAATAAIAQFAPSGLFASPKPGSGDDVGIYVDLDSSDIDKTFKQISGLGFKSCEIYTDKYGMDMAKPLKAAMDKYNIKVLALFTLGPGPSTWDFYGGPGSIGLVCKEYREARINAMMQLSDLASACGIGMIETHVGFIPENPNDPNYAETVEALKKVVKYCSVNNQYFLYHAGQETPTTLMRTISDVGYENQGIGFDTANLIMYDRGHPNNALDIYGKYIRLVNAKDGVYPIDPKNLGSEVQIGQGKVGFPLFFKNLKAIGYEGPVIIEREAVKGVQWEKDVCWSKEFLKSIIDSSR